jgi:hypothetical protein
VTPVGEFKPDEALLGALPPPAPPPAVLSPKELALPLLPNIDVVVEPEPPLPTVISISPLSPVLVVSKNPPPPPPPVPAPPPPPTINTRAVETLPGRVQIHVPVDVNELTV